MRSTRWILLTAIVSCLSNAPRAADMNGVTPGEFIIDPPTLINLGFEWFIDGDDNRNASVDVSYRKAGERQWKRALPLLRLQGERIYNGAMLDVVSPNMFAGSILDLSILNLGAASNPRSDAEREASIAGACALLTGMVPQLPATCPNEYSGATPQQQFGDCVAFMHTIPYGTWDRANSNTAVCRQLHTLLTPFRPAVHCPHAGKTGGNACVEFTYESFFETEF